MVVATLMVILSEMNHEKTAKMFVLADFIVVGYINASV